MAGEDKSLSETLQEVIGETKSQTQDANASEAQSGLSRESQSAETNSGETATTYQGIDLSDIPEQDRPRITKALKDKFDLADKGIQKKFQEVAPFKKAMEDITNMGLTIEEAKAAIIEKSESKKKPLTTGEKKTVRLLDQLLEQSPTEQRESLRQMRQITQEEAGDAPTVKELKAKVEAMEKMLGMVSNSAIESKKKEITTELDSTFTKKYGKDFIDKHREKILDVALKNPNVPIEKIIKYETPDDEYEQALLASKLGNRKPLTQEKKESISSSGQGGITNAKETVDTSKSWKDTLLGMVKK